MRFLRKKGDNFIPPVLLALLRVLQQKSICLNIRDSKMEGVATKILGRE